MDDLQSGDLPCRTVCDVDVKLGATFKRRRMNSPLPGFTGSSFIPTSMETPQVIMSSVPVFTTTTTTVTHDELNYSSPAVNTLMAIGTNASCTVTAAPSTTPSNKDISSDALCLILQIMQVYCNIFQRQNELAHSITEAEAIEESIRLAEAQHGHHRQLDTWASDNGYLNLDRLIRKDGNCGADCLALLLTLGLTSRSWSDTGFVNSLSHAVRIQGAQFLRRNADTPVPGYFGLTFADLPRPEGESYADFCDRMTLNGEHLEMAMFAAFAMLRGVRIRIVTSTNGEVPFESLFMPAETASTYIREIVIGNLAMSHYMPFSSASPLLDEPLTSNAAVSSRATDALPEWLTPWIEPLSNLIRVEVTCHDDIPHLCDTKCASIACERCKNKLGTCFFTTQISRGTPALCIPSRHGEVMATCVRCRAAAKKSNIDGCTLDEQGLQEWDDAYHLAGFAMNSKVAIWYTAPVRPDSFLQYYAVKNTRMYCACSQRRKGQGQVTTASSTSSSVTRVAISPVLTRVSDSVGMVTKLPSKVVLIIQEYNIFHIELFNYVTLNGPLYMVSVPSSTSIAVERVSHILDFGFTQFDEFARLVNTQARCTIEQARVRGINLHNARQRFHTGTLEERQEILALTIIDHALRAVIQHDIQLIQTGFIPVVVERALVNTTHGFAGTPDVIFYRPASLGKTDQFLITDLKYTQSVKPLEGNPRPSNRFTSVFGASSCIFDTTYHKYGLQLNAYYFLLVNGGYAQEIRAWFCHPTPADSLYSVRLAIVTVHDSSALRQGVLVYPYEIQSTVFRRLLDAWLYGQGRPELTQRAIVTVGVEADLQKLPEGVDRDDTLLGALLSTYTTGKRQLVDEQFHSLEMLQSFGCQWTCHIQEIRCTCRTLTLTPPEVTKPVLFIFCEHPATFVIKESGDHNDLCREAARARRIQQQLSPHIRAWCVTAFRSGLTVHQIEQILFSRDYPLSSMIVPPPRPVEAWNSVSINLRRFTPTTSALRSIEQSMKKMLQFDPNDQLSVQIKLNTFAGLGALCGPLQLAACKCPQVNLKLPECVDSSCVSFRAMWMASWQVDFLNRPHAYLTVFIDGTGQVNQYGYQLITVMVLNPVTMRGIPIAHMMSARVHEEDLRTFLTFVRTARPGWSPRLCIIDKDLTEYNGIRTFAAMERLNLHVFICFFHAKQAIDRWMTNGDHAVPKLVREWVHVAVRNVYNAKTVEEFELERTRLLEHLAREHPLLHTYFQKNWFCDEFRKMWSLAFVPQIPDYVAFTNNYIESWHKLLKDKALRGKHNRRLDKLLDILMFDMHDILFRALYGRDTTKLRTKLKALVDRAIEHRHCVIRSDDFTDREAGLVLVRFGGATFEVRLAGYYGDGPYCPCPSAEPTLCIHILIALCGIRPEYTFDELQRFGFVGTRTECIYRTLRGTRRPDDEVEPSPLDDDEDEPSPLDDEEVEPSPLQDDELETSLHDEPSPLLIPNYDAERDRQAYRDLLVHLEHLFTAWHKLSSSTRRSMEKRLWCRFSRGISEKHHLRRSRTGARVVTKSSSQLPNVRGPGRPKSKRQPEPHASGRVVQAIAANVPLSDTKAQLKRQALEKGQHTEARNLIDSARGLNSLTVIDLKNICRAFGLKLAGTKHDLITRIQESGFLTQ